MTCNARSDSPLDLQLIAQRVLKLAEIATLEHLDGLWRSQAGDFLEREREPEQPSAAHAA